MPPRVARATGSHPGLLSLARLIARAALREVLASEENSGDISAPGAVRLLPPRSARRSGRLNASKH
jgi:hypothetical protein